MSINVLEKLNLIFFFVLSINIRNIKLSSKLPFFHSRMNFLTGVACKKCGNYYYAEKEERKNL